MKLQLERGAAWKRAQPGGMLPLRGTSQRISARRDEAEGLHPKGEHLEGSSSQGARLRESSRRLQPSKHPRGAWGSHRLWPKQRSHAGYRSGCHCWSGKAKCLWVKAASEVQLRQANPGHVPAPNPSGQPREAVRRQQSVPGEMSLAPAGGRGGRGAALGCCRQR